MGREAAQGLGGCLRVVFFGSGLFALPILERLLGGGGVGGGYCLKVVVTQPPRRSGRGQKIRVTPVEEFVLSRSEEGGGVEVLHSSASVLEVLRGRGVDVFLTVCYGEKLSGGLLSLPRLGSFNLHGSLLPRWRGAAPIARAILAGDRETGVSVIRMNERLDAGDIVSQVGTEIGLEETSVSVESRLGEFAAAEGIKLLRRLVAFDGGGEAIEGSAQLEELSCRAPALRREESWLDWRESAEDLSRRVRALQPWPGSIFHARGERIKVLEACAVESDRLERKGGVVGEILRLSPELWVSCGPKGLEGLSLRVLQRAGRSACSAAALLRGFPLSLGSVLGGGGGDEGIENRSGFD